VTDSGTGAPYREHGHAEVWRQDDRHWRWAWFDSEADGEPLVSTYTFSSHEEAEEDAETAYPGAVIRFRPGSEPKRKRRAASKWLVLALVAAGIGAASGVRRRRADGHHKRGASHEPR
jgi:hypothetical protein